MERKQKQKDVRDTIKQSNEELARAQLEEKKKEMEH